MNSMTSLGYDNMSMLFGSLSSSSQSTGSIYDSIGTYKSIKNGSYGKLLNAYYDKVGKPERTESKGKTNVKKTEVEDQKKLMSSIKIKANELTSSAAELATTGSKSLFKDKDGDTKEAVSKIEDFVEDYNNTITAAKKSTDNRTNSRVSAMVENTENYKSKLSTIGISLKEDNTLSIDKDKLGKASMDDLKSVFNGVGSFAATTAQRAARVQAQASLASTTSSSYTASGRYNTTNVQNYYSAFM